MSRASPARTSPTTSRSGRMRSAARTSARTVTPPAPSALGGRASSRTTCGCASRSSAVSSMVTMRSVCGIDCDNALSNVVLPALVAPATRRFHPAATVHRRNVAATPSTPNSSSVTARVAEATDGDARAVDRERRDHRVQAGAVGEAGVDHRRGAVEPQPERCHDPFDEVDDARGVEVEHDRFEPAGAFHVGTAGTVDHHLGDGGIGEQRLERPEPGDLVGELLEQASNRDAARSGCSSRSRSPRACRTASASTAGSSTPSVTRRWWTRCLSRPSSVDAGADGRATTLTRPHRGDPARTPSRRTTSVAARASGSGSRVGSTPASTARAIPSFTGIRASTGRSSTSPISLAPKRPARLVEQHDTGGVLERGRVHGSPQREVAAAQHDDRDVGHLDHCARGRLARGAAVDEDRRRPEPERHRERGAALGCRQQGGHARPATAGQQGDAGGDLDQQAIERLGGRLGAGVEPVGQPDVGIGAETEHGREITGEIGDAHTGGVADVARLTGEHERARGGEHGGTGSAGGGPEGDEQRRRPSSRGARAPATRRKCTGKSGQRTTRPSRRQGSTSRSASAS